MLYTYKPEDVGGKIIFEGSYSSVNSKDYHFGDYSISIKFKDEDGFLLIFVFRGSEIIELTSSVELEKNKHPDNDKYFILKYKNIS